MAITQVQKPSGFVGVYGRLIIALTSTNVALPKFRYKINLYTSGTTLVSTAYIDPDPQLFGVHDCAPRLQNLVEPQINDGVSPATRKIIFDIDPGDAFARIIGAHEEITVNLYESYAATVDDEPVDQALDSTFTFTIYAGSTNIDQGINVNTGYGVMDAVDAPSLINITDTDSVLGFPQVRLGNNDRFCLAWFNDNENSVEVIKWRMLTTFENGSTSTEDITVATYTTGAGDGTMLYFMCGPLDLSDFTGIAVGNRPSAATTWVSYILQPFDASTAIGSGYLILRDDRGCKFDSYQLCFTNIHGAWSFHTFNLLSSTTIQVENGKSFIKQVGGTDYGNSEYGFDLYDREKTDYGGTTKVKIDLNSNWLTRGEAQDLESVIYSRDVRMLLNGSSTPVPVTISNRAHKYDKYKNLRQYKITVEVAQKYYRI